MPNTHLEFASLATQASRPSQPSAPQAPTGRIQVSPDGTIEVTDLTLSPQPTTPTTAQPPFPPNVIPGEAVAISMAFFAMIAFIIVGLPIARAFGRRMDRRGLQPAVTPEIAARVERIEQAVDAIAIEVERVSEGQRFTNRLMSERAGELAAADHTSSRG